jgi:hypothetical protein
VSFGSVVELRYVTVAFCRAGAAEGRDFLMHARIGRKKKE